MQTCLFKETSLGENIEYNRFFLKTREYLTLLDILRLNEIPQDVIKEYSVKDLNKRFVDIKNLKSAGPDDISFFINPKYLEDLKNTKAGLCVLKEEYKSILPSTTLGVFVKNPHYVYTKIANFLFIVPQFVVKPGISPRANIDPSATIGDGVEIQAGACIGREACIGDGCKICANAFIGDRCIIDKNTFIGPNVSISYAEIGQHCVIQNGAAIGQCGFGFAYNNGFNYKIPQLGIVRISNFVEIGANSCVDRGAIGDTCIGDNTKIDNLVHIGHGVTIGRGCFFAGGTVVAGSVEFGNFVQVGGHSAINGHIKIGDGVIIAGHSGVAKSVEAGQKIGGAPAMNLREWERLNIFLYNLMKTRKKNLESNNVK